MMPIIPRKMISSSLLVVLFVVVVRNPTTTTTLAEEMVVSADGSMQNVAMDAAAASVNTGNIQLATAAERQQREGEVEEGQKQPPQRKRTTTTTTSDEDIQELVSPNADNNSNDEDDKDCKDEHKMCHGWAQRGECESNPNYMLQHCKQSCKACGKREPSYVLKDEVKKGEKSPEEQFGVRQTAEGNSAEKTRELLKSVIEYMETEVLINPKYDKVRAECQNRHDLCTFWATIGECEKNPSYMTVTCAPSCKTCHLVDFDTRCPYEPEKMVNAYKPGEMHDMFQRVIDPSNELYASYKPIVHSRPKPKESDKVIIPPDQTLLDYKKDGPWVVTFENFLSEEECDRLIRLGHNQGYARSTDVGAKKFDGSYDEHKSEGRTSHNAWCKDGCQDDPIAKQIMSKIENVTGVPTENSEHFQILKYEKGEKYNVHHDYIPHQRKRQCGPRILTFFLYLSDVEAGGGTDFPLLGITVMPKKGKALLWPSVLDDEPDAQDWRTKHAALPVEEGVKYAANSWIHLRDFMTPNGIGCS